MALPKKAAGSLSARLAKQADDAALFLRVLANGHRLRVLCLLVDRELSVGEINTMIEVSQSVLSQHLAVLREHKLVRTRRSAQTIYYSIASGPVNDVIVALHEAFCREQDGTDHGAPTARPRESTRAGRLISKSRS